MDNSRYCKFILLLSIVSVVFFLGYQFTCLNPLVPVLDAMYNQTYYERYGVPISSSQLDLYRSLTFSMLLAGAFVGSLTVTTALRFLSRKQAMIGLHVITIIGTLIIALGASLSGSYEAFITGRFVIGYSVGCGVAILSLVIAEISVYRRQSFYNTIIGIGLAFADTSGPCIAHPKVLGTANLWPIMIAFTMLPSIFYICCVMWIPETPYQILRMHGRKRTKILLRKLRVAENNEDFEDALDAEIQMMENEQSGKVAVNENEKEDKEVKNQSNTYVGLVEIFTTKQYRMQLFGVVALYGFEMLCGINNVLFYSDEIFREAGIPDDKVTYGTIGGLAMMIVGSIFGTYMAGRYGEKIVILGMSAIMCFSIILITVSLATVHLQPSMAYVSIVGVIVMYFGFSGGPNVTIWSLGVAITTEPTRPNILLCGGAIMWFSGWLVGFLPPYLKAALGPYGLLVWLGCSILFMLYCTFFIPDTKGKTSDEIQNAFK